MEASMAYNGSGTFNLSEAPFVYDTVIDEAAVNSVLSDMATNGLTNVITKNGQTTVTANLPMATFRHTGVGNASARTDYAAAGQVQDGSFIWCGTAGGTANALTLTPSPAITAYTAGQSFRFIAASDSTLSVTVAVSGLTTKAIQIDGVALAFDLVLESGKIYQIDYDGTQFQATRLSDVVTKPTVQTFTANGTWTKPSGCTRIVAEAVGGGGGGGGCAGTGGGTYGAAGGGGSGSYGKTAFIDVTGISSGTIVIGSAGTAGADTGTDGGAGGSTTFNDGTTTWTWPGGAGGAGEASTANGRARAGGSGGAIGSGTGLRSAGDHGQYGLSNSNFVVGGSGGSTDFGLGGAATFASGGGVAAGAAGTGYGSGGSGASANSTASDAAGGAGTAGFVRVWEYY